MHRDGLGFMAGLIGPVSGDTGIRRFQDHVLVFEQDTQSRPSRPTVGFVVPEVTTAAVSSGYSVVGLNEVVKGDLVDFYA